MSDEIQILNDGDGVAIFGRAAAVDRFLAAESLSSRAVDMPRLSKVVGVGGAGIQAAAEIQANSARWVKLTKKSAELFKGADAMKGSEAGAVRAILTKNGKTSHILEIVQSPGALLSNPAVLTGAAGIMAQLAMQQAMDEITDYLAVIDAKVDDVLRAQRDTVVAGMIGASLVIDEAITIRDQVGHVSATTWSKVQATSATIASTQAYALLQIDASAERLEKAKGVGDLATAADKAQSSVHEWLAVLARCVQLQEGIGVLELDRVLADTPEDLENHRLGLRAARTHRHQVITETLERLQARLDAAASTANAKVLLHPGANRSIVGSRNVITGQVVEFQTVLGGDRDGAAVQARRWLSAVADTRDKTIERGTEGFVAARRRGSESIGQAKARTSSATERIADRAIRLRRSSDKD